MVKSNKTRLKLWSNLERPVKFIHPELNPVTFTFCANRRHAKCVKLGKCQAEDVQNERGKCRLSGMDYDKYIEVFTDGSTSEKVAFLRERDAKVQALLAILLKRCRPWKLTMERL